MNTKKTLNLAVVFILILSLALSFSYFPASASSAAHSAGRNVQTDGVGNPFNFGERNTSASDSPSKQKQKNHSMTVQQVKYMIMKEVDEHWDLLKVRLGVSDREKVYALFLGLATRESTIGGNGNGCDLETQGSPDNFANAPGHAYGCFQTAVTAYKNNNKDFMTEYDVPEMKQYDLTKSNFYDGVISTHMGIRKIIHFAVSGIKDYDLSGYSVIRNALKGFNTGWAEPKDQSAYTDYADEIAALAHWYYSEGHLYDNEFTWHTDQRASSYRNNPWGWLSNAKPSLNAVSSSSVQQTTAPTEPATVNPNADVTKIKLGDSNMDGKIDSKDASIILQDYARTMLGKQSVLTKSFEKADVDKNKEIDSKDATLILVYYAKYLLNNNIGSMEKYLNYE